MAKPSSVMPETRAQRTLVKSPPELWAEISDAPSLARRLSAFGEVRITRKEPETAVAWEGASVRGTVELAASGWGTKVTITAERLPEAPAEPEQDTVAFDSAALAAALADEPRGRARHGPTSSPPTLRRPGPTSRLSDDAPAPREGFLARLKGWWHTGRAGPRSPRPRAARPESRARSRPEPAPSPRPRSSRGRAPSPRREPARAPAARPRPTPTRSSKAPSSPSSTTSAPRTTARSRAPEPPRRDRRAA